jgi:hypothetical protein
LKKSNRLLRPCAPWQVFRLRELLNDPFLEFLLSGFTRTDMGYAIVVSQDDAQFARICAPIITIQAPKHEIHDYP